jgi:hypothetical protein
MRFIGNQPIPEHVNPPEDLTQPEEIRDNHKEQEIAREQPERAENGRKRRGRVSVEKPRNREAA